MELKDFFDEYMNGKFFDFEVIATREAKGKNGKTYKVGDIAETINASSYEELKQKIKLFATLCCSETYGVYVKTLRIKPEVKSEKIDLTFMAENEELLDKKL